MKVTFIILMGLAAGCSDAAAPRVDGRTASPAGTSSADPSTFDSGTELRVEVPESGRAYVKLDPPSAVTPADPATSVDWDLAFEGFDVFTNGGASGSGRAAAFGPLDAIAFVDDVAPAVPFLFPDRAGGAFLDWYDYEGAPSHALWSRYHVFGVKDGDRLWKVQLLTYYGERDGAPVAGLYRLRYAELTAQGSGPTVEPPALDGSAGGPQAPESTPSECLDLATGARTMLTPAEARASVAWHLCFRRQTVSVNGEIGGPRGVGAVDLDADRTATETIEEVKARTPESELARFDAVTAASFEGRTFRGDRVVRAFGDAWIDRQKTPLEPARAERLVVDAAGKRHLVGFVRFESPTPRSVGAVVMRIKPTRG
mgnify:CR=1 FL=1